MKNIRSKFAAVQEGKGWLRILQSVISLTILAFLIHFWMIPSQAEPVQRNLEKEFKLIPQPPQAIMNSYTAYHKGNNAVVEGYYSTTLSYQQVRSFYEDVLQEKGWHFQRELEVKEFGGGPEGKQFIFCKGNNRAAIYYDGVSTHNYRTYAFSLSWGLLPDLCSPRIVVS